LWHMIFMSRGEVTGYDDDLLWHVTIVMSHNEFNLEFRATLFLLDLFLPTFKQVMLKWSGPGHIAQISGNCTCYIYSEIDNYTGIRRCEQDFNIQYIQCTFYRVVGAK
jgi:hypothetical protein